MSAPYSRGWHGAAPHELVAFAAIAEFAERLEILHSIFSAPADRNDVIYFENATRFAADLAFVFVALEDEKTSAVRKWLTPFHNFDGLRYVFVRLAAVEAFATAIMAFFQLPKRPTMVRAETGQPYLATSLVRGRRPNLRWVTIQTSASALISSSSVAFV